MASIGERVIGRSAERARISGFLGGIKTAPTALVIEGEPGIGKTTLWTNACMEARAHSIKVLPTRPTSSEAKLSFVALTDLLDAIPEDVIPGLPEPQARALRAVKLIEVSPRQRIERRTVGVATLSVLRELAARGTVLIAIDEAQWLDRPSAAVIRFALRRFIDEPVGILMAIRVEDDPAADPLDLRDNLGADQLETLRLGPLSPEVLHTLIRDRFGVALARPAAKRLASAVGGNPLFALEVVEELLADDELDLLGSNEPLPIPADLRSSMAGRLRRLTPAARRVALVASLAPRPTVSLIRAALPPGRHVEAAIRRGVDARVFRMHREQVRFTHPLLASVIAADASSSARRRLHRRLAELISDPEKQARHLGLAYERADSSVAERVERGARIAHARGAPESAAELQDLACRLTPRNQRDDRTRRALDAAEYEFEAGDTNESVRRLQEIVAISPRTPLLGLALYGLGKVTQQQESWTTAAELYERAAQESAGDPTLRAVAERDLAVATLLSGRAGDAATHAARALHLTRTLGDPALLAGALAVDAYARFFLGEGLDREAMEQARSAERWTEETPLVRHPSWLFGQMLKWAGELGEAREMFEMLQRHATERGNESFLPPLLQQRAELECWVGDLALASRLLDSGSEVVELTGQRINEAMLLATRGLVDSRRGRAEDARAAASRGLHIAIEHGAASAAAFNQTVLGGLALASGDAEGALEHLGPVLAFASDAGIGEPGVLRFLPDAVEAQIELGLIEQAESLLAGYEERSRTLDRPLGLATAGRCRGLLAARRGDLDGAHERFAEALAQHARATEPFDLARTLLAAGQVERRMKHRRSSRELLERALREFVGMGAEPWATRTRVELGRTGKRQSPDALTATEEQVAALVAQGKTNREIAAELFISEATVESNLWKMYRKLGVRSRTELARWFVERSTSAQLS